MKPIAEMNDTTVMGHPERVLVNARRPVGDRCDVALVGFSIRIGGRLL